MAFKKPQINVVKPDLKNASIYIRSVKKWGKSTLFRDVIIAKYGDPNRGLLVEVGMERGATMLDNVNTTHVDSYKDLTELAKWLIEEKGKEHNIEIVAFDVADELVPIFDKETIRQSNAENPSKMVKSIRAAMGGYTEGEKFSANLMKMYFDKIKAADMQVWVLGHSKYKSIKDKGSIDDEGYMQLTSNLSASYEAALGDIFDIVLTGVIDRNIEVVGTGDNAKRYATDAVRKLYFRGTPEIDAGVRFAADSVPEYLVFDKPNMAADFIRTIEDGMAKSRTLGAFESVVMPTSVEPTPEVVVDEDEDIAVEEECVEMYTPMSAEEMIQHIRTAFAEADDEAKKNVRNIMSSTGCKQLDKIEDTEVLMSIMSALGINV